MPINNFDGDRFIYALENRESAERKELKKIIGDYEKLPYMRRMYMTLVINSLFYRQEFYNFFRSGLVIVPAVIVAIVIALLLPVRRIYRLSRRAFDRAVIVPAAIILWCDTDDKDFQKTIHQLNGFNLFCVLMFSRWLLIRQCLYQISYRREFIKKYKRAQTQKELGKLLHLSTKQELKDIYLYVLLKRQKLEKRKAAIKAIIRAAILIIWALCFA